MEEARQSNHLAIPDNTPKVCPTPAGHASVLPPPTFWRRVRGVTFCLGMFFGSFFGSIFFLTPYLPLMLFRPTLYRFLMDHMIGYWEAFVVAMLRWLCGVHVTLHGEPVLQSERSLLIMNHRTRLDWLFFWACLLEPRTLHREKICLKRPLKYLPGPGWAMQCAGFLFVQRNWQKDQELLATLMDYYTDIDHDTKVLLFPEGTDFSDHTKWQSDEYARKNNLQPYEFVLHPRTTGFSFLVNRLQEGANLDAVYDVTVAYPSQIVQNESQVVTGQLPERVEFHVRRYPITELPRDQVKIADWLTVRWVEKERVLRDYYACSCPSFSLAPSGRRSKLIGGNHRRTFFLSVTLVVWSGFCIGAMLCLLVFTPVRWYVLASCTVFYVASRACDGSELLAVRCFRLYQKIFFCEV